MQFDTYQFILCVFVLVMLTSVFTFMICNLVKNELRIINAGLNDEKIKTEYEKTKNKKQSVIGMIFDRLLLAFCCVALFISFGMSISLSACNSGNKVREGMPAVNVVRSGSMSYISPNHKFLDEGEVTDQLYKFDVVFISAPPKEEELKVNDIVVYEFKGDFIIHRIVAIEEPNAAHPNERYFLLQGDANDIADRFPVTYEQIKGIYNGTRIPFIGSFILFMQSPAGWLCVLLVVFSMIATPIAEKKLAKARKERIDIMYASEMSTVFCDTEDKTFHTADAAAISPSLSAGDMPEECEPYADNEYDSISETDFICDFEEDPFAHLNKLSRGLSFKEKLSLSSDELKERYNSITSFLYRIVGVRIIEARKSETFKKGNTPIVKFNIKGKTLNAYIGLEPSEYENTKYIFGDASDIKAYANYPMRVKVTSQRQARWVIELLNELVAKKGLELSELPAPEVEIEEEKPFSFANLKKKKTKSFKQRIKALPIAKERYMAIKEELSKIDGIRLIEGKKSVTYKLRSIPIIKLNIRGKTLIAYLGLDPNKFTDSKYIFTDASAIKTYANYPMRIKVTSNRQVKWTKELIQLILKGSNI